MRKVAACFILGFAALLWFVTFTPEIATRSAVDPHYSSVVTFTRWFLWVVPWAIAIFLWSSANKARDTRLAKLIAAESKKQS